MKIAEMNNCIEKMREIYNFDDTKTYIKLDRGMNICADQYVQVSTTDANGTEIEMSRRIDELVEVGEPND